MRQGPPKQLNVRQQNAEVERRIRSEANHWRKNALPKALKEVGEARGIVWARSIVVDLDLDFPGMPQLFGLLVTQDERFVRFELSTDETHEVLESIDEWADVTSKQNLNPKNPGIGAGFGALAIKVLRELSDA
jgi:hypothetical protein